MCVWEGIKYEDVFNFLRAEGWYINSIMKNPFDFLAVMWVSLRDHMVAQCYFGASTMSGLLRGLQALMSDIVCPMVLYMHCWAYRVKISTEQCHFSEVSTTSTFFLLQFTRFLREHAEWYGKMQHHEFNITRYNHDPWSVVVHTLWAIIAPAEHFAQITNADRGAALLSIWLKLTT